MSSFKHWMSVKFEGCRHIASTHDPYRKRDVKVFAMPGDFELVGISDGTDSWIAPVSANPFVSQGIDVKKLLSQLREGTLVAPADSSRTRHRIIIDQSRRPTDERGPTLGRRLINPQPETPTRRRIINV
jgi:hypothetical protein